MIGVDSLLTMTADITREVVSRFRSLSSPGQLAILAALPGALVLVVGVFRLGDGALTLDETTSYYLTQIGWSRFFEVVAETKTNMWLYFAILRVWPFIDSEAGLRSLSVVFGVAAVLVFVVIARRFMTQGRALAAAIVLGMSALFVAELRMLAPAPWFSFWC